MRGETTRTLVDFASKVGYDDLPPDVMAKTCLVAQVGIQLFLSALPTARRARAYAEEYGAGRCTILGSGMGVRPEFAAFANGVAGRGLELDDYHLPSHNHPRYA